MDAAEELTAIAAELRRLAARTEHLTKQLAGDALTVFDPEVDEPPVRPLVDGDRAQRDWCSVVLWGRLFAINVRQHRGATKEEVVAIAKAAGYTDGRGWNRWTGWEERDGGRWALRGGFGHLRHYYEAVSRTLPFDLADAGRDL